MRFNFAFAAAAVVVAVGCGGGGGGDSSAPAVQTLSINNLSASPVNVGECGSVSLDSVAFNPAGTPMTYQWSAESGSFSSATQPNTTFYAPELTSSAASDPYRKITIALSVSDGSKMVQKQILVTVNNTSDQPCKGGSGSTGQTSGSIGGVSSSTSSSTTTSGFTTTTTTGIPTSSSGILTSTSTSATSGYTTTTTTGIPTSSSGILTSTSTGSTTTTTTTSSSSSSGAALIPGVDTPIFDPNACADIQAFEKVTDSQNSTEGVWSTNNTLYFTVESSSSIYIANMTLYFTPRTKSGSVTSNLGTFTIPKSPSGEFFRLTQVDNTLLYGASFYVKTFFRDSNGTELPRCFKGTFKSGQLTAQNTDLLWVTR